MISSGVRCASSVVGSYWISSIRRLRWTTLPGDRARLRPGAKAVASTMLSRPSFRSAARLRAPSARLAPPVSIARRSAAGFEASSSGGRLAGTTGRGGTAGRGGPPAGGAGAAAPPRAARRRGIRGEQQRRAHGVDELPEVEFEPPALRLIHALRLFRALLQQPVGGEQVGFLQRAGRRVGVPLRRGEPLVAAAGRGRRPRPRPPAPRRPG